MSRNSMNILAFCALCFAVSNTAGQTFYSKVVQLLQNKTEKIKCFSEQTRDLACFWEEEGGRNGSLDQYTFTYKYQNENSSTCTVIKFPLQGAGGKPLFLCRLPRILCFASLHLSVLKSGQEVYNRTLFIDQVLFLDPPTNVSVVSTGKQGELNVTWLPPAVKYIDDSIKYEIQYSTETSSGKKYVEAKRKFTLQGLSPGSKYKVMVRVKPDGVSYDGHWSAWSEPQFATTPPSVIDPLIVALLLIISLILVVLSLTVLLSHHKFTLKKLWPEIPSPEHKFPGLFTVYKGDFQEWLGHSTGSRWPVHLYTEELPAPVEVLSEVSLASLLPGLISASPTSAFLLEEAPALEDGKSHRAPQEITDRWQEPLKNSFQEHPEALLHSSLLESQDTYVTLNHDSQRIQRDDSLEETLPLQILFESKDSSSSATSHSDIGSGSGRLSSQSSFDYPNHTWPLKGPGYTYMTVADSGVSMDYSPMSSNRTADMSRCTVYANEYKNYMLEHRHPTIGRQPIDSGF